MCIRISFYTKKYLKKSSNLHQHHVNFKWKILELIRIVLSWNYVREQNWINKKKEKYQIVLHFYLNIILELNAHKYLL